MKRYFALGLTILLLLSVGCKKRLFHYVATVIQAVERTIDEPGSGIFNSSYIITKTDFLNELNLPEGARINAVNIESIAFNSVALPGNQATQIVVTSCTVNGTPLITSSQTVVIAGAGIESENGIKTLAKPAIDILKNTINGWLKEIPGTPTSLTAFASGTIPPGLPVKIKLIFVITASVENEQCIEFPDFIGGGEECDIP